MNNAHASVHVIGFVFVLLVFGDLSELAIMVAVLAACSPDEVQCRSPELEVIKVSRQSPLVLSTIPACGTENLVAFLQQALELAENLVLHAHDMSPQRRLTPWASAAARFAVRCMPWLGATTPSRLISKSPHHLTFSSKELRLIRVFVYRWAPFVSPGLE